MMYDQLVRLAKEVAAQAAVCRILGQDGAAFNLVQAGDELERAAVREREAEEEASAPVGEEVAE